jgi:hypothetical protein
MKKICFLSVSFLFLFSFIQTRLYGTAYLNISIYDDSEFFIEFDKVLLKTPGNYAEFDSVTGGEHDIKISKTQSGLPGEIIYSGKIKIPMEYALWYVVDEYGSLLMYKKVNYSKKESLIFYNAGRKKCGGDKNLNVTVTDECTYKVIKDEDFKDLKKSISDRNFEITNIDILKSALDKNIFKSEQIRELLSYFTFEYNKIDIAKYAYKNTCDKKNYFKVYDAFIDDSSVNELKEFINKNK